MTQTNRLLSLLIIAAAIGASAGKAEDGVTENGLWILPDAVKGGTEVELPRADRNITAAYFSGDAKRVPITTGFVAEGGKITLQVPEGDGGKVVLEVAEKSVQFPGGRIVLSALDAKVEGDKAKLESHPGNHRIGFWSDIVDTVNWNYKATRPGMYDVEVCYSLAGGGASEVRVDFGAEKVTGKLRSTGSWYRYTTASLGRVYFSKPGMIDVSVVPIKKGGGAVMNLKAITLRPAPEGEAVTQAADGSVELDASAATVHSTLMQYERKSTKLCLGYWAKSEDWASWTFPIAKPGKFKVELTQGCGGAGGSEVELVVAGKTLPFTVEGTGGFQNWKVRELGEVEFEKAGEQRLEIRPKNKKGVAVMDVRRVRLVPVE